ncbi:hypothetical protein HELRODRAFT_63728, partial [Helobdella robusta]|uniref:RNB domain-containing protein n=1 Tax=Helobdella robusta TaxID=6412 RepID=T1FXJ3_HELRO
VLRINQKNYEEAYISHPDGRADIFIYGLKMRNRSLNGDIVYVKILPKCEWKELLEELKNLEIVTSAVNGCLDKAGISNKKLKTKNDGSKTDKMRKDVKNPSIDTNNSSSSSHNSLKDYIHEMSSRNKNMDVTSFHPLLDLFPPDNVIRTGKVVGIAERVHNRCGAGTLKLISDKNKTMALFSPRDYKIPRILIPAKSCPENFFNRPDDFKNVMFIGRIVNWYENKTMPIGEIIRNVGNYGEIEPETQAILFENNIDFSDFSEEVLSCLPADLPWKIPEEELKNRRDFRRSCVFTIDPESARDLDDALSCEHLGNGLYEVGVHIADVSYFVKPNTKLDQCAASRSTSVYMVQRVIPMLPRLLCEQLCSLNPGVNKLTFSVVWRLTDEGEILDEWFGRTVIRSCVKLSYSHAQGFIDNPKKIWNENELPEIANGFTIPDVVSKVLQLYQISKCLKEKRVKSGTLRLDQIKLTFSLDKESSMPRGFAIYEHLESHSLIEEFMLLANMAVAHKILQHNPQTAVLRRHPLPSAKALKDFLTTCKSLNLNLDASSAGALQQSLNAITEDGTDGSAAKAQIIVSLCLKSMQQALYFCSGEILDHELWRHYALNVPLYTHFTSPIRRYPDVLVHRLLARSLGYDVTDCKVLDSSIDLQRQCVHSNQKKSNSKTANDKSIELFFAIFVKECGPLEEDGMVCNVLDRSFDVYIFKLATTKRIYCEKLPLDSFSHEKKDGISRLILLWSATESQPVQYEQVVAILTHIKCLLVASADDTLKWNVSCFSFQFISLYNNNLKSIFILI